MLTLTRYPGEKIVVTHEATGDQMLIQVEAVGNDKHVKLYLTAEKTFLIDREEIYKLTLTRDPGEKIVITHEATGETILIQVGAVWNDKRVKLHLTAEKTFLIDREEIHKEKAAESTDGDRQ